jgi:Putative methyltransferase
MSQPDLPPISSTYWLSARPSGPSCVTSTRRRCGRPPEWSANATWAPAFDVAALAAVHPRPDIVLELGLYGIYHDDARVADHLRGLGDQVRPSQIVCNVQARNPEIEYIARVWRNHAGEPCVWRLRPASAILAWMATAGYAPASITRDRHGIYRVLRLTRQVP